MIIDVLFLVIGIAVGGLTIFLLMKGRMALEAAQVRTQYEVEATQLAERLKARVEELANVSNRLTETQTDVQKLNDDLIKARADAGRLSGEVTAKDNRISELQQEQQGLTAAHKALQELTANQQAKIAELETNLLNERTQSKERLDFLNQAREHLTNQFKALADEILENKTKKFTEQNQTNLKQLLDPLKERIVEFEKKVHDVYDKETKDRTTLAEQVRQLAELNTTLSKDAQNLTLALKGDKKAQGNWGEIILEDILERAGLQEGIHYDAQGAMQNEDDARVVPDIVLHLPGDRHVVIDSKMTLPDYRAFSSADDDEARQAALAAHLAACRAHMKGLSEKKYQSLYGLKSLDFVIMFVPLEPAFMLAVTHDPELFHHAWEKNVLLVCPSTLLFVVRTVATLWRQEDLSRNAQEISKRGGELYDKLVGFVQDLQQIGERLRQAQDSFDNARRKLSDGKGNVIRQAELLKNLGVKPSKALPSDWVDAAVDERISALAEDRDRAVPVPAPNSTPPVVHRSIETAAAAPTAPAIP